MATALARLSSNSDGHPNIKNAVKTIRSIKALIQQHPLPPGTEVIRALAEMEAWSLTAKTAPASAFQTTPFPERLIQEMIIVREFIDQQKTELNESLALLRTLHGRAEAEADTGDRPGSEKGRTADPMQVIAFSLPMEDGKKAARLKVFYPSKGRGSTQSGFRISLMLSMDRMGHIRADIFTNEKTLDIKFSTENEPTRIHIGAHLDQLGKLLNGHFEAVNLSAAVDEKSITAFEYEDLETTGDRMVDLQAITMDKQKKAAAITYDSEKSRTPQLVAAGRGLVAEKILEIARACDVPIREDRNLVHLLEALEINSDIPEELYRVVAEVLVYIYRLDNEFGEQGAAGKTE